MIEKRAERPAFGALLRRLRLAAGLSQEQLAERARISVQAVSALERGVRRAPRADTLALLRDTLQLEGSERAEFEATASASMKAKVRTTQPLFRSVETGPPVPRVLGAPRFGTHFLGRERERREVAAALSEAGCVTLWGTGGVGKTRLAVETIADRTRHSKATWSSSRSRRRSATARSSAPSRRRSASRRLPVANRSIKSKRR